MHRNPVHLQCLVLHQGEANNSPSKTCPKASHSFVTRYRGNGARVKLGFSSVRLSLPSLLDFKVWIQACDEALQEV